MPRRRRDASLEERVEELEDRVDALVQRLAPTSSSWMDDALDAPAAPPAGQPVNDAEYTGGDGDVLGDL